jgi:hypothetical protein
VGGDVDVPALGAQRRKVGDRRLRARQHDEGGITRQRRAARHEDDLDRRLLLQGVEVVEVGDARQHRHRHLEARPRFRGGAVARADGVLRRQAVRLGEPGHEAEGRPAGALVDRSARPSSNSRGSPRKRLTRKPRIMCRVGGRQHRGVPTRLAMTPPRSMSPTSTTGTSAARAKPMLAMSPAAQVDLRRAAGALDDHEVGAGREPGEAASTSGNPAASGFKR